MICVFFTYAKLVHAVHNLNIFTKTFSLNPIANISYYF